MTFKPTPLPLGSKPLGADAYEALKDSIGRYRTLSLFVEHKHDKYPAPFTLKNTDQGKAISMYRKYMEIGDPTEYGQAIALLGNWEHWVLLTNTSWFKPIVEKWREELRVKFESDRFREMQDVAENHPATPIGVQATKWLAERYSKVDKPKRGRPSKAEKQAALHQEKEEDKLLAEEAERLGL